MLGMIIINKMRSFLLFFVTLFRRALCCFRRRRRLSYVEPLTDIGIVTNKQSRVEAENWNKWGNDDFANNKPTTIQEHIEFYRQQKTQLQSEEELAKQQTDFFNDMTPRITRQKKVFINTSVKEPEKVDYSSLMPATVLTEKELGEWVENSGMGWDGEKLEWEAMEVLKEKKRLEREKKALEQQQRRIERSTKSVTINVKANA